MMIKERNRTKRKIAVIIAVIVALLFVLSGCKSLLDGLLGMLGGSDDITFDPKVRGDSRTSTIFSAHLHSIPEEERADELPVDSFPLTVDFTNELKAADYTSSEKVNLSFRKLLETVVSGKRPIIAEDANSPLWQVWSAARAMLNEYIREDFSQYEIVHTIYDWSVYYIDYDHDLLDTYMNNPIDLNDNDPAFHLSGAFLSGLAVCDGISKAFSLLCAMEGIEVERVLGWYPSDDIYVGHAWNKVNIVVPGEEEQNWFFVDPTFASAPIGDTINGERVITEYLTHAYFLLTDEASNDHLQDDTYVVSNKNKTLSKKAVKSAATAYSGVNQGGGGIVYNDCVTEFDYYQQELNESEEHPTQTIKVSELQSYITNFAIPNKIEGVEVRVALTASTKEVDTKLNSVLSLVTGKSSSRPLEDAWWFYCGKDNDILMLILVFKDN